MTPKHWRLGSGVAACGQNKPRALISTESFATEGNRCKACLRVWDRVAKDGLRELTKSKGQ